jgi:hypothetical protein
MGLNCVLIPGKTAMSTFAFYQKGVALNSEVHRTATQKQGTATANKTLH